MAFLESKLQQAEDTKKELEAHYQRECENLCQRIRELVRISTWWSNTLQCLAIEQYLAGRAMPCITLQYLEVEQ